MKYPLLVLAFFWLIGLYIGYQIPITMFLLIVGINISLLFFSLSVFSFSRKSNLWFVWLVISLILFAAIYMGWYKNEHQSYFTDEITTLINKEEIGLRGYINSKPYIDGDLVKFNIKPTSYFMNNKEINLITKEKILVYIYLREKNEKELLKKWQSGMGISLFGQIGKINVATNPGQFNYKGYLEKQAIFWKVNVFDLSKVVVANGNLTTTIFHSFKERMSNSLNSYFNEEQAGFMKSILLGDRQDLSVSIKEDFSILGISHLLAISGLHLSILTMMIFWVLLNLGLTRQKTIYIVSAILVAYMLLTGASASIVRATVMTLLMLYGIFLKQSFSSLQVLGIAFIGMTLYQPMWIYDVGFQLSFIITFYILWGIPKLNQIIPIKQSGLKSTFTILIITQTASFPIAFYYFHQYSILSWLANLVIVPIFSLILLPMGVILLFLSFFNLQIGYLLAILINYLLQGLFKLTHLTAQFSLFHLYGNVSSIYWVLLYYVILTWILIRSEIKESFLKYYVKKIIFSFEMIMIAFLIVIVFWTWFSENEGMITYIDVGQGDSILVQTPSNQNLLIDSGGKFQSYKEEWQKRKNPFDVGEDILLPYLRYKGVDQLDVAILTHEDLDHIGGYLSIVDDVKIQQFIVNAPFPRTKLGKELYDKLLEKNVKIVRIEKSTVIRLDKASQLTIVPINILKSDKENDHSLVLFLNVYQTNIVFSGDLEEIGEAKILNQFLLKHTDILTVGHHGSNTSTSVQWLLALKPNDSIISVGKNNRYNHPTKEVLDRLSEYGSEIWRTDLDGAIVVTIKQNGYSIDETIYSK